MIATDGPAQQDAKASFPIVGIGASAGGLEAVTQLLQALPVPAGVALIHIQHLDPNRESLLTELLSRITALPVCQVQNDLVVEIDHLYVARPDMDVLIQQGRLRLQPRTTTDGLHMSIDLFFRSLAEDQGHFAIGVILSGAGTDGALGLSQIKDHGGITFVQDARSAKFAGMPRSAMAQTDVDFVMPPQRIAQELVRIGQPLYVRQLTPPGASAPTATPMDGINRVLRAMHAQSGVDFGSYKSATVQRRVLRRMMLHKMERLEDYSSFLNGNKDELAALFHDLLIKVTAFFRDADAYQALNHAVIPKLLAGRSTGKPLRVWVAGCATGEEVYSLAICLLEARDSEEPAAIQIFATDLDETAIGKARAGKYIENIAMDVSEERLQRFFVKDGEYYTVKKSVRDLCTFARHNLCKDPPYSHIDLIVCRNVLIYLERPMYQHILELFHYALRSEGYLMLGTSESVGAQEHLFSAVDKTHKIYVRASSSQLAAALDIGAMGSAAPPVPRDNHVWPRSPLPWREIDVQREADRLVLSHYAPIGVVVNEKFDIVQFRGDTRRYLTPPAGKPTYNLLKMVRDDLLPDVEAVLADARKHMTPVNRSVGCVQNGQSFAVVLKAIPLYFPPPKGRYAVLLFEHGTAETAVEYAVASTSALPAEAQLDKLREELEGMHAYLQALVDEHESANEELKSANEEILSSNEELQSTNEELETAREELQATIEELATVNDELHSRNSELNMAINDFDNLFINSNIAVLLLDRDLCIRRFTPLAGQALHLLPSDVGRPLGDLALNTYIDKLKLDPVLHRMLEQGSEPIEVEQQDSGGRWHLIRVHPYRTQEGNIDGVVLTLININAVKSSTLTNL